MNVIAFDSSSDILTVALGTGDAVYSSVTDAGLRHAEQLLPSVRSLLRQAGLAPGDLELVVCSRGPGSFTGLRIGMATAKGLSAGSRIPFVAVPTLDLLAWGLSWYDGWTMPAIDARKGRFYTALYRAGGKLTADLDVIAAEAAAVPPEDGTPVLLTGPHAPLLAQRLPPEARHRIVVDPLHRAGTARALLVLGEQRLRELGPAHPDESPLYLRLSEAERERLDRVNGAGPGDGSPAGKGPAG